MTIGSRFHLALDVEKLATASSSDWNRSNADESRDSQQLQTLFGHRQQFQIAALTSECQVLRGEHPETRAVQILDRAQIEDHFHAATVDEPVDPVAERDVSLVAAAAERDDGHVTHPPFG